MLRFVTILLKQQSSTLSCYYAATAIARLLIAINLPVNFCILLRKFPTYMLYYSISFVVKIQSPPSRDEKMLLFQQCIIVFNVPCGLFIVNRYRQHNKLYQTCSIQNIMNCMCLLEHHVVMLFFVYLQRLLPLLILY